MGDENIDTLRNEFFSQLLHSKGKEDLVNAYNSAGQRYDKVIELIRFHAPQQLCDLFYTFDLPKDAKILDIGAGTGAVGKILHQAGYTEIHALDASSKMLEICKELPGVYKEFYECFITKDQPLPLPPNSFDAVLMSGVIFPNAMTAQELKQVIKVVKKDGVLGLSARRKLPSGYDQTFCETFARDMNTLAEEGFWKPVASLYPKTVENYCENQNGDLYFMQAL